MRVYTKNKERAVDEMIEMFYWVQDNFSGNNRWLFGKDPDFVGSEICYVAYDIEWFDFADDKDAEWFMLRWS